MGKKSVPGDSGHTPEYPSYVARATIPGDDGGISRYWYDFCNNLTGVTMGVATYKGMYAAKLYSPAEEKPPQCSARLLPGQGD